MKITILVPVYNEQEAIVPLYKRLSQLAKSEPKYTFEFLFVSDGSKDKSLELIKTLKSQDNRISFVNLSRNFGKEIAMQAGIDQITNSDATVIIDADLQDPPELISKMLRFFEQGYNDVSARRRTRQGENWFVKFTAAIFYRTFNFFSDIPIQLDTGDFRLLSRPCIEALQKCREKERFTKGLFSFIGYSKKEILYDRDPRYAGHTKFNFFKRLELSINAFTSFTTKPLRLSSILGFIISIAAFIYALVLIIRKIFFGADLGGYTSLMAAILLLGGLNLLFIGILGEYIGKIFKETKDRPLYFIEESSFSTAPKTTKASKSRPRTKLN